MSKNCYCGSIQTFAECCQPFIQEVSLPKTAEELMRSRYSAYATLAVKYLVYTTHASKRKLHNEADIFIWAKENNWLKLEIISTKNGKENDQKGIVEFKAYYQDKQGFPRIHHEISSFLKENGQWYYLKNEN